MVMGYRDTTLLRAPKPVSLSNAYANTWARAQAKRACGPTEGGAAGANGLYTRDPRRYYHRPHGSGRTRTMSVEVIEHDGTTYAEIIWADVRVEKTTFFSPPESSFQFGLLAHRAGYEEAPHRHKERLREITDLQQMFMVQRGTVDVLLYTDSGALFREIRLGQGDAIVLIHGVHAIRVVEDFQALSVKQGPFFGDEEDKVNVESQ